jgi:biotin transport system substrate-specific component
MFPVPMTLQSLAVVALAAVVGRNLAVASVTAYLLEGAAGLPVFAGGAGGVHHLAGPTGGFLFSFLVAAALVGEAADRGLLRTALGRATAAAAGHAVIFAVGGAWLAAFTGLEGAFATGVAPFVVGTIVKIAVATLGLTVFARWSRRA